MLLKVKKGASGGERARTRPFPFPEERTLIDKKPGGVRGNGSKGALRNQQLSSIMLDGHLLRRQDRGSR